MGRSHGTRAAVRAVVLMFVFGDAGRLVWQTLRTHKFLIISSSGDISVTDRRDSRRSQPTSWVEGRQDGSVKKNICRTPCEAIVSWFINKFSKPNVQINSSVRGLLITSDHSVLLDNVIMM